MIICLCRNIILVGGSLSLNSSYGQDVIGLGNAFHKLPILQNEGDYCIWVVSCPDENGTLNL